MQWIGITLALLLGLTALLPVQTVQASSDLCSDTCSRRNGRCEDGGSNSVTDRCAYGTDCSDCGTRSKLVGCSLSHTYIYITNTYAAFFLTSIDLNTFMLFAVFVSVCLV